MSFHGAIEWIANQPQDAGADVPAGKIMSLSFASSCEGFKAPLPEHIDEDLRLLVDKTQAVRTYAILGADKCRFFHIEGLPFALGYTFYNQQLLTWLLYLSILSFPFWISSAAHKARI